MLLSRGLLHRNLWDANRQITNHSEQNMTSAYIRTSSTEYFTASWGNFDPSLALQRSKCLASKAAWKAWRCWILCPDRQVGESEKQVGALVPQREKHAWKWWFQVIFGRFAHRFHHEFPWDQRTTSTTGQVCQLIITSLKTRNPPKANIGKGR